MRLVVKGELESYSYRQCRCGQAMLPTDQHDRRWVCTICGRTAR